MSDALPLPSHPHLGYYKKLAKDLVKACDDPVSLREWATRFAPDHAGRLVRHISSAKISKLADAQFLIARAHGFASWPKFSRHVEELQHAASADSKFEQAADAIVSGDIATVRRLLDESPELIRQRSSREHRSTLLHYVSANGIEDFRQRTPQNIVEIARLLLDAGADVNSESDAYRGHSMTLGLAATSIHPERAGVQIELMELLLERGAMIERISGEAVRACLANGRPLAARFLATRGAYLNFENAAGAGDLDRVKELASTASNEDLGKGFVWASAYGYNDVVAFLLDYGIDPGFGAGADMTGLHLAAHEGHLDIVKLLLAHNAPLEAKNSYGGTVLDQTLWSAVNHPRPAHGEIVKMLIAAGAKVEADWRTGISEIDELLRANADPVDTLLQRGRRLRFSQPEEARTLFAEAAKKSRESGARRELVDALKGIAQIDRDLGRRAEALPFYEEAVSVCREIGDPLLLAHTVRHLGDLHHDEGRDNLAEPLYDEALALYRASETPPLDLANALRSLAVIKGTTELWEEAFHLYAATNVAPGVVETALRLVKLAHRDRSREWLRIAKSAAEAAGDEELRQRVRVAGEELER
ncbi:MAG: tetratricopeptide repeat protein [Acidobacteria bacterium]|nr:tetratricopeptide repeat protein [Acidobacteriota bacterium]MBV9070110.1 tetratricopeptide repeat protein [Acidobacteriota bacterium]MBV9185475.1 tetratricopeptide repeat protein [Acidobacteriota bacterium]